jgi:hypothetical protein
MEVGGCDGVEVDLHFGHQLKRIASVETTQLCTGTHTHLFICEVYANTHTNSNMLFICTLSI